MIELPSELTRTYSLQAGETDAQGRMPLSLIIGRVIEVATAHADILGLGYADLIRVGAAWVLSRLSVEMVRYPRIGETYSFTTWIESYNRLYSDRCFLITDAEGREVGHVRSMWVAIDIAKRSAVDLTQFTAELFVVSQCKCPVPMPRKIPMVGADAERTSYTFKYSDIDFNRHVNTLVYVRQLLNFWSVDFFDHNEVRKFSIAFHNECHYGDQADILCSQTPGHALCEIAVDGRRAVAAEITFENNH